MKLKKRMQSGVSLLEIMVTLLLVTIGLLVVMTSFVAISKATRYGERMKVATTIARMEMERFRNTPYASLSSGTGAYHEYPDYPDYRHEVIVTEQGTVKEIVLRIYFENDRRRAELRTYVTSM